MPLRPPHCSHQPKVDQAERTHHVPSLESEVGADGSRRCDHHRGAFGVGR